MRLLSVVTGLFLMLGSHTLLAEEVTLDHQGITLNANLSASGDDWTKRPVVLMTHGTLGHRGMEIISGLQKMLAEREVSSLAINLSYSINNRASAMYDCKTAHDHKHTDALDEIGAWMGWLKNKGVKNVALLGHSRGGGQVAWFVAERHDPAITHAFLIGSQIWSEDYAKKDYEKRYKKTLAPVLEKAKELVAQDKGKTMMDVDFIYCESTKATADAVVGYYDPDERFNSPTVIQQAKIPVIVFVGSEDNVYPHQAESWQPLAEGEKIRLEIADGADHFFRDLYSEDIADIIAEAVGG